MANDIEVVRLQERTSKKRENIRQYLVTVPKHFVDKLGWSKGNALVARIVEIEVDGVKRKGVFYYRP